MTTVTMETLEQEYTRLTDERAAIKTAARKAGAMTPEGSEALRSIGRRLKEIAAIPPQGYALPKAIEDLVAHAETHGWVSLIQWPAPGDEGKPFVTVQVGRKTTDAESRGDAWHYQLTWHSRDCAPGKVKRFGSGLAKTPDAPQWHNAPSMKAIRAVIEQHPVSEAAS
ncbi:hypothetical protein [Streptomyces flavidovirens]